MRLALFHATPITPLNSFDLSKLDQESFVMDNGRVVAREKKAPVAENSLSDRLKKLKELKDKGVISEQEYQEKRDSLVNLL